MRSCNQQSSGSARKSGAGAALMLALWALFLLSALVISWALDIDSRLTVAGMANRRFEAEALACSGAEVAMHPSVEPGSPNLSRKIDNRKSYKVQMTGEGGRLNLNWLIAGEDPTRLGILRRYLTNKGIDINELNHMIDCLLDWVDPDDLERLNGAEASDDYRPPNHLLTRVDELRQIKGWEDFTSKPGWEDDFTLNSSGPVDLAWASRDVLLALPGMTEGLADRYLQFRRGPDGLDGTSDDAAMESLDDARAALGFSPQQFSQIGGLVIFRDAVFRIVSVGRSGEATRMVQMVVRRPTNVNVPQVISWKEL
jgi:Type II secretion system (T2SS), protein K